MKARSGIAAGDALLLWLACAVATCAGFTLVFGLLGAAIEAQQSRVEAIATVGLSNARSLAQRPQLERTQTVMQQRLRKLRLDADRATTVAEFIRVASHIATAHGARVLQIDERTEPAASLTPAPANERALLEAIPLDVVMSGSYTDLLATVRDLGDAAIAMRVDIAALERASGDAGAGNALTAHLRVELEHLPGASPSPAAPSALWEDPSNHARPD